MVYHTGIKLLMAHIIKYANKVARSLEYLLEKRLSHISLNEKHFFTFSKEH